MQLMQRNLILLTIFTLIGLGILVSLGSWQLKRLAWKNNLTEQIMARTSAPPISLEALLNLNRQHPDQLEYQRVKLQGRFLNDYEQRYYAMSGAASGWHIYTPFKTTNGLIVLVNRGFVPDQMKQPATRPQAPPTGRQTLIGIARYGLPHKPLFSPDNDPARNLWYWRDLSGMASHVRALLPGTRIAPFFVEAERTGPPDQWPHAGVTRIHLVNHHLQYALTWFGLALALLGVYFFYLAGQLRKRKNA